MEALSENQMEGLQGGWIDWAECGLAYTAAASLAVSAPATGGLSIAPGAYVGYQAGRECAEAAA